MGQNERDLKPHSPSNRITRSEYVTTSRRTGLLEIWTLAGLVNESQQRRASFSQFFVILLRLLYQGVGFGIAPSGFW